jgi:hypothetical protein
MTAELSSAELEAVQRGTEEMRQMKKRRDEIIGIMREVRDAWQEAKGFRQLMIDHNQRTTFVEALARELEATKLEVIDLKQLRLRDRAEAKMDADVFKGRLAYELEFDHKQYKDAEGMEMTVELGEVMRDRLKSVFKVLEKRGLKIG